MDEKVAALKSLGARAPAPNPSAIGWFALLEEFWNIKSVSDPLFPNVEDMPSERSGGAGRLTNFE